MEIIIEEYLSCKNKMQALRAENERESFTSRYYSNLAKLDELQKACDWALASLGTIGLSDERSAIL